MEAIRLLGLSAADILTPLMLRRLLIADRTCSALLCVGNMTWLRPLRTKQLLLEKLARCGWWLLMTPPLSILRALGLMTQVMISANAEYKATSWFRELNDTAV